MGKLKIMILRVKLKLNLVESERNSLKLTQRENQVVESLAVHLTPLLWHLDQIVDKVDPVDLDLFQLTEELAALTEVIHL